jgi:hypothetical protein
MEFFCMDSSIAESEYSGFARKLLIEDLVLLDKVLSLNRTNANRSMDICWYIPARKPSLVESFSSCVGNNK